MDLRGFVPWVIAAGILPGGCSSTGSDDPERSQFSNGNEVTIMASETYTFKRGPGTYTTISGGWSDKAMNVGFQPDAIAVFGRKRGADRTNGNS